MDSKYTARIFLIILLAGLLFFAGCASNTTETTTTTQTQETSTTQQTETTQATATTNQGPTTSMISTTTTTSAATSTSEPGHRTWEIEIKNFAYNPPSLSINAGDTVVWTNRDSAPHTVTSDSGGELDSPTLGTGDTYSHTFQAKGTFAYHCTIHPSMHGSVTVQ